jgi:uncharacterized protein YuzE
LAPTLDLYYITLEECHTTDMEQMMAHLLAKIRTNGEEMKEEMWAW